MSRFRPDEHIRRRADFAQAYERGIKIHGRFATIFVVPTALPLGRLGIAATKRLGGAVERNRAKRLVREIFRRHKIAPGFDVVIVPKRELLDASLTALESEYRINIDRSLRRVRISS